MASKPEKPQDNNLVSSLLSPVRGLASLILRTGEGITRLSARVHLQFSHLPWLNDTDVEPTLAHAPFPYRATYNVFYGLRKLTESNGDASSMPSPLKTVWAKRFLGILNGVVGDKLDRWENPLSLPMELFDESGRDVSEEPVSVDSGEDVIVFLHGLCMNEEDWDSIAHRNFVRNLRNEGFKPFWLSYNTGRPIPENGREFHQCLDRMDSQLPPDSSIILVGHSMGGLVTRSAFRWASDADSAWVDRITHAAYLGSPHFGAPLERLGHNANSLLGLLPFTEPFMSLGLIRSLGIQQLRHGTIHPEIDLGSGDSLKLPDGTSHLLIGTTLGEIGQHTPIGDGLVPLSSALGRDEKSTKELAAEDLKRVHLEDLDHFQLMKHPDVYSQLEDWLGVSDEEIVASVENKAKLPAS